jgi:iron complex outermembrane receptor protein
MRSTGLRTALLGLLASTVFTGPAFAQGGTPTPPPPTPATQNDQDEIVVTAQKREENLQDVPISIQALGTRRLEELNVSNFEDYTKLTPSVSFQTFQPGTTNVYIRGVASGGDGNHSGSLPSVGVYLDEQPVTTIGGTIDVHIYDIARIEVLRGPQGTLYGASSEAGTIRIITNKPDKNSFYGGADGEINTVSHGGIGGKVEGFFNAPLGTGAALRVVGWYQHDAGYIDNIAGTRSFLPHPGGITINNSRRWSRRTSTTSMSPAPAPRSESTWPTIGRRPSPARPGPARPRRVRLRSQPRRPQGPAFLPRPEPRPLRPGGADHRGQDQQLGPHLRRRLSSMRKINTSNDYTDYAEAYDNLYSSYGGLAGYFYFLDNAGNTINPSQHIIGRDKFTKMSHELRIASPADKRLRFVGGLFYQRQYHRIHQDYQVTGLGSAVSVNGFPGTLWLTQQDRVDKDYAAFGEASFDILENLTFTGGIRAYKYDNSLIGFFGFGRNPGAGFTAHPFNGAGSSRTGVIQCFTTTGATLKNNITGTLLPPAVPARPAPISESSPTAR